jgi:serine/threonine protein phosphatase PrpC
MASFLWKEVCPFILLRPPDPQHLQREMKGLLSGKRNEMSEGKKYEQKETVYPFSTEEMLNKALGEIDELKKRVEKIEDDKEALETLVKVQINTIKYYVAQLGDL